MYDEYFSFGTKFRNYTAIAKIIGLKMLGVTKKEWPRWVALKHRVVYTSIESLIPFVRLFAGISLFYSVSIMVLNSYKLSVMHGTIFQMKNFVTTVNNSLTTNSLLEFIDKNEIWIVLGVVILVLTSPLLAQLKIDKAYKKIMEVISKAKLVVYLLASFSIVSASAANDAHIIQTELGKYAAKLEDDAAQTSQTVEDQIYGHAAEEIAETIMAENMFAAELDSLITIHNASGNLLEKIRPRNFIEISERAESNRKTYTAETENIYTKTTYNDWVPPRKPPSPPVNFNDYTAGEIEIEIITLRSAKNIGSNTKPTRAPETLAILIETWLRAAVAGGLELTGLKSPLLLQMFDAAIPEDIALIITDALKKFKGQVKQGNDKAAAETIAEMRREINKAIITKMETRTKAKADLARDMKKLASDFRKMESEITADIALLDELAETRESIIDRWDELCKRLEVDSDEYLATKNSLQTKILMQPNAYESLRVAQALLGALPGLAASQASQVSAIAQMGKTYRVTVPTSFCTCGTIF